jgi:uncharacterized protein YbaP (TraB family)
MLHIQKTAIRALLGTIIVVGAANAQQTATETSNLLWKVESETNTVWLLGSVHVLDSASYPLADVIEDSFLESETLVLELNLDSAMSGMLGILMQHGFYNDGRTLSKVLPEETYELLKTALEDMGTSVEMVQRMKPWMVGMMLMTGEMQGNGLQAAHGVDMYFQGKATERGIPVIGLETTEDQINAFDGMSDDVQIQFLHYMLTDTLADSPTNAANTIKAYKAGDVEALENILTTSFADQPELYAGLVADRNRNWIPQIEKFLTDDKDYMVVVGALHLIGKDSVIEMLRAKGYRVDRL